MRKGPTSEKVLLWVRACVWLQTNFVYLPRWHSHIGVGLVTIILLPRISPPLLPKKTSAIPGGAGVRAVEAGGRSGVGGNKHEDAYEHIPKTLT